MLQPRAASPPQHKQEGGKKDEKAPFNPYSHYDPAAWSRFPEHMASPLPGGAADRLRAAGLLGASKQTKEGKEERPLFSPASPSRSDRYVKSVAVHPINLAHRVAAGSAVS